MTATFSPEIRAKGRTEYLDEVEQGYVRLAGLRVPEADSKTLSPTAKVPVKVIVLLQVGLRRVLELSESFIDDINAGRFTPPFVSARAAVETAFLRYFLGQKVEDLVKAHDAARAREFDVWVMKALVGGKSTKWTHPDQYSAHNVLTVIQHLSKRIPKLTEMYELLCEYAHPNYDGMTGVYQRLTARGSAFIDHPAPGQWDSLNTAMGMAGLALMLTIDAVEQYQSALPAFIRLCEEDIRAMGTR